MPSEHFPESNSPTVEVTVRHYHSRCLGIDFVCDDESTGIGGTIEGTVAEAITHVGMGEALDCILSEIFAEIIGVNIIVNYEEVNPYVDADGKDWV